jgi:hypothetical protein
MAYGQAARRWGRLRPFPNPGPRWDRGSSRGSPVTEAHLRGWRRSQGLFLRYGSIENVRVPQTAAGAAVSPPSQSYEPAALMIEARVDLRGLLYGKRGGDW